MFALIAHRATDTNSRLLEALRADVDAQLMSPAEAEARLRPDDAALARLDVLPTIDGVEPGTWELARLEAQGLVMLNRLRVLLTTHDKLQTARVLSSAGVPHPKTRHVKRRIPTSLNAPLVVKPRFGSWGADVFLCRTRAAAERCIGEISDRPWFRRQGVLVQELVPPLGHDLRIVVAGGCVVGAVRRVAAEGEWRTNVALGAKRQPADPPPAARELALSAAAAAGADLVGVDLLPTRDGGWTVLELNGAVEFTEEYSLGPDVFGAAAAALVAQAGAGEDEALAVAAG
jgi:glutamate---[amino group carrier protein] ligase